MEPSHNSTPRGLQVPEASKPYIKPEDVRQQIMEWWGSEKMQINEDLAVHKPFLGRKVVWKSQPEPDLLRPKDWTSESLISVGKVDNERIAKDFARLRKNPSQVSAATLRQSTELLRNSSKVNFAQWRTYGSLLFRAVVAPDADDRIRRGHGSFDAVSMLESRDRLFSRSRSRRTDRIKKLVLVELPNRSTKLPDAAGDSTCCGRPGILARAGATCSLRPHPGLAVSHDGLV